MKLKCIGGECNGQTAYVEDYNKVHDQVRVRRQVTFTFPTFEEDLKAFRENRTPDYLIQHYLLYKIAEIHFPSKATIKFLIPTNWTDEDALRTILDANGT